MPRPNLFASPARASSIFIPGILPFLAPRVFAPWPKELGQRKLRSEPEIPRQRHQSQVLRALERASLEKSNKLAAALGELDFGNIDESKERQSSGFVQTDQTTEVIPKQTADAWDTSRWHLKNRFQRTCNEPWHISERKNVGILGTGHSPNIGRLVRRSWSRQRYTYLDKRHGLALGRLQAIVRRRNNFNRKRLQKYRKFLAAAAESKLIKKVEEHPPERYISLPGTAFVSVLSPHDSKLQDLRLRLGEKKWASLRAAFPGKRHVLNEKKGPIDKLNNALYHEIQQLDGPQLSERYNQVQGSGVIMHAYTRMQFIHSLARKGQTATAARALKTLREHGADFATPQIMQLCSTLLQNKHRIRNSRSTGKSSPIDSSPTDLELFDWMMSCGLQPNCIIYNILIRNSFKRGDRTTAYEIYNTMKERGVEPNNFTFSILLNDAKNQGEMTRVQQILELARQTDQLDRFILADLLHAIFLLHRHSVHELHRKERHQTSALEPMFGLFRQYFFTQPFLDLIPPHRMPSQLITVLPEFPKSRRLEPDAAIFVLMLNCMIGDIHDAQVVLEFYRHFQKLVKEDHPSVCSLTTTTAVYDIFLKALGRWEETLPVCAEVLQDMMSPAATETEGSEDSNKSSLPTTRRLQPSVSSWSILLKAFMKHEQPRAAEKVLKMMQDRGVTPSDVTWHYLIGGYAIIQDIQGAFDARDRMIAAGFAANDDTEWRLSYIKNKDALNRMRVARDVDKYEYHTREVGEEHEWNEDQEKPESIENREDPASTHNQGEYESNRNQEELQQLRSSAL